MHSYEPFPIDWCSLPIKSSASFTVFVFGGRGALSFPLLVGAAGAASWSSSPSPLPSSVVRPPPKLRFVTTCVRGFFSGALLEEAATGGFPTLDKDSSDRFPSTACARERPGAFLPPRSPRPRPPRPPLFLPPRVELLLSGVICNCGAGLGCSRGGRDCCKVLPNISCCCHVMDSPGLNSNVAAVGLRPVG